MASHTGNSLAQVKRVGGVGSIIALVGGLVPWVGPVVALVGLVLVLLAVKKIADMVADQAIFTNYLIFFVLNIIGAVALVATAGGAAALALSGGLSAGLTTLLIGLALFWVFLLTGAIFLRKSFNEIAAKLNHKMFATTALLYLIGAALIIAFGIGAIIVLVAYILQIVAFFTLPDRPAGAAPAAPQPPAA